MKRFQFGLEQVLRLKRQRQRAAELRQQEAQAASEKARSAVASLADRLAQAATAFTGAGGGVDQWLAQARYAARLEQDLRAAEAALARADEALREADAHRTKVSQEVETLVVVRNREWAEYCREAARHEQQRLDELALRRWQSARTAQGQGSETVAGEPME